MCVCGGGRGQFHVCKLASITLHRGGELKRLPPKEIPRSAPTKYFLTTTPSPASSSDFDLSRQTGFHHIAHVWASITLHTGQFHRAAKQILFFSKQIFLPSNIKQIASQNAYILNDESLAGNQINLLSNFVCLQSYEIGPRLDFHLHVLQRQSIIYRYAIACDMLI